ncbi:MAG: bifunctional diguanylate cyclase/phosphodiesterase, partial [Emcibacteraceae bacterium]|nr:bifunctional diguanylate cyclase/phosphodiesterase [Emcibacteraceae bacterium]
MQNVNQDVKHPIGSLISSIFWGDDINDDKLLQNIQKSYMNNEPIAFIWQVKITHSLHMLLCKIIPLIDKDGNIMQLNITTSDYDDTEHLEIEVDQYNHYDPLTGLPNKFKFFEILENDFERHSTSHEGYIASNGINAAVLFVNVRKLQRINESYGYDFGDRALKAIALELENSIHKNAYLSRFSNDKFVIYLSEEHFENVKHEASVLAQAIHHNITKKNLIDGNDIRLSVSIGIATGAASNKKIEQIMQNAHLAMKRNNAMSTTQTVIFNDEIRSQATRKLILETEFREALEQDALELHYQPIVNLQSGLLHGFEALARWNTSSNGSVSPIEFITLAEEVGLIIPLGEWALTTACTQLKSWIDNDPLASALFMAVNISSTHIISGNIEALTRDALAKSGLDGSLLKLELTESTIMENSDLARNILLDLKTHGVSLAVDDFGTGYSSLSYLSRIPADTLKIDRAFVSNLDTDEGVNIVRVIINLAKSLGMTVVSEG